MAYTTLHDKIALKSKGHDFTNSFQQGSSAYGVVCDGVSNSFEQAFGAETALSFISGSMKRQSKDKTFSIDYSIIYQEVNTQLTKIYAEKIKLQNDASTSMFATTVITGFVSPTKAEFSYCGNGAILEIRREWFELPNEIPTPWGVNNYLNPHSRFVDGESKLFKTVKATKDTSDCQPDIISISRKEQLTSYFMICSDGLYSSDEISTGWDGNQYYLVENERFVLFLQLLKKHHRMNWTNKGDFCKNYMDSLAERNLVDDDLSYVLFIPEL